MALSTAAATTTAATTTTTGATRAGTPAPTATTTGTPTSSASTTGPPATAATSPSTTAASDHRQDRRAVGAGADRPSPFTCPSVPLWTFGPGGHRILTASQVCLRSGA